MSKDAKAFKSAHENVVKIAASIWHNIFVPRKLFHSNEHKNEEQKLNVEDCI